MLTSDRHVNIKTTITELCICCLVDMPHCMFSKTKGLIGVRLFSISSSCDCTHDTDHSGTEAENGLKQTELMFG